jgi:regulator of sirC expression with transglutaminase-like and TPR domain
LAEPEQELAVGALLIAAEEYPQLAPEPYLHRLELLAERVRDRLREESAPPIALQELGHVLFREEGFRGNAQDYYDPRNSFLNDVMDRRVGIPITLGIIYLEVGWRLGLPLQGVNFPSHFLVGYRGQALRLLIDPYNAGRVLFEAEARSMLAQPSGPLTRIHAEPLVLAQKRDILVRLLTNLKRIYTERRDDRRNLGIIDCLLVLRPDSLRERCDRGMVLARLGRVDEAIAELESYLARMPHAPDALRVRLLIRELRTGGGIR